MLTYKFDQKMIEISEAANGEDIEFHIHAIGGEIIDKKIKGIQQDFEHNEVLTDVLFYAYKNHKYQFIVKPEFYSDFILSLMKHQLLLSVAWENNT
jgi:hypothetical protein